MTRQIVYGLASWIYLATIGLTLAAIIIPEWISWDAFPATVRVLTSLREDHITPEIETFHPTRQAYHGPAKLVHYSYGLHSYCSSVSGDCRSFPVYEECTGPNRKFCSLWRTTGFLMSMAVVIELSGIVGFAIILLGGKQKRENGWKVILTVVALCAASQAAAMAIMLDLFDKDEHFFAGWYLGKSFVLATVSWVLQALVAIGILVAAYALPEEGGYELIPDRTRSE